jgi:hypothetical protein
MKKRKGMDETCQLMILVAAGDRCCLAGIVSFSLKLLGAISGSWPG